LRRVHSGSESAQGTDVSIKRDKFNFLVGSAAVPGFDVGH
jgi:hypothetical protein